VIVCVFNPAVSVSQSDTPGGKTGGTIKKRNDSFHGRQRAPLFVSDANKGVGWTDGPGSARWTAGYSFTLLHAWLASCHCVELFPGAVATMVVVN
jgi:hypothetical protein